MQNCKMHGRLYSRSMIRFNHVIVCIHNIPVMLKASVGCFHTTISKYSLFIVNTYFLLQSIDMKN